MEQKNIILYLALTSVALINTALAATEKYSATIEDGTPKILHSQQSAEDNTPAQEEKKKLKKSKDVQQKRAQSEDLPPVNTAKNDQAIVKSQFDEVPKEKMDEIAVRIKYTYEILKRFGRAYDYRSTTLSQLKQTLAELEKETKN